MLFLVNSGLLLGRVVCSSSDVVLGSSVTSWMSRGCVPGVILVGCFKFSPFVALTGIH